MSRPTAYRSSSSRLFPLRSSSRETTAQEQSARSKPSSPLSLNPGYVAAFCFKGWYVAIFSTMYDGCKLWVWFQLSKQHFEETMQTLNNLYAEAEKLGGKSYLEGCLACLTGYTIFLCMETHYEQVILLLWDALHETCRFY